MRLIKRVGEDIRQVARLVATSKASTVRIKQELRSLGYSGLLVDCRVGSKVLLKDHQGRSWGWLED